MKILFVMNIPYFPGIGGASKANRLLAEQLAQLGDSVRVVAPLHIAGADTDDETLSNNMARHGLAVERREDIFSFHWNGVEVGAVKDLSKMRAQFNRLINEFEPDWVIVSSEDPSHNLLDAAMSVCQSKVIYIAHTPAFLPFGPQSFLPSDHRTKLIGRVPHIISISKFSREYLQLYMVFGRFL